MPAQILCRHGVLFAAVISLITILLSAHAQARSCSVKDQSGACVVRSGAYYVRVPETEERLERLPIVVLLHDAGQSGANFIRNERLMDDLLDLGYAVIVPRATKRKYVRRTVFIRSVLYGGGGFGRMFRSHKRYIFQRSDGSLKILRQGRDRGWYFYNTDHLREQNADLVVGRERIKRLGRDELAFLREVLFDASRQFWLDTRDVTVIGIGHGASLAWQIACVAPGMARLVAPVNGAYWGTPPSTCRMGGRVIHTHEFENRFWPMYGSKGTRRRFGQEGVWSTADLFAFSNGCARSSVQEPDDANGLASEVWHGCKNASSLELILLDRPFDFPDWWLDRVLGVSTNSLPPELSEAPREESLTTPRFVRPDEAGSTGSDGGSLQIEPMP